MDTTGNFITGAMKLDYSFVFQMLLPAFETQDIGLDLLAILNAFGVDETRLVQAGTGETQVLGTGGSDYVYVTGEGSETYNAKGGADIFLVGKDFGHDTIADVDFVLRGEAADEVRFAHAKSTDVYAYREGQDLVIEVKGTDDVLRIRDQFLGDMIDPIFKMVNAAPATRMSVIVFADGVIWDQWGIAQAGNHSTDGAKLVLGSQSKDYLEGGKENDRWRLAA